jgi:hypothetical protein
LPRACWKLRLQQASHRTLDPALDRPLKAMLGLERDETLALAKKLPFDLIIAAANETAAARIEERLKTLGFEVRAEPARIVSEACKRHPRLAASEMCPRCGERRICAACAKLSEAPGCDRCLRSTRRWTTFRRARIGVLLAILGVVAVTTYLDTRRVTSWKKTLTVGLYPIAGDDEARAAIAALSAEDFRSVGEFFDREASRYGVGVRPVLEISLGPEITDHPPPPPGPSNRTALQVALWSLEFRWWVFRTVHARDLAPADIRVFAFYHSPRAGGALEHSLGLEKGHVGVVHVFGTSEQRGPNAIVIAHELLHTTGATDKYDEDGRALFPDGYASPDAEPRFPQRLAEIMAGRIPVSERIGKMPDDLEACIVGPTTAREIGWTK